MSSIVKSAIDKNKPHFLKYKKYITDNDWTIIKKTDQLDGFKGKQKTTVELRAEEFKVQDALVKAILERLKSFVKKSEGEHGIKIFKDFVKDTLETISIHTNRADDYTTDSDLDKIKDVDLRASEIAFHNDLFKAVSSIEDIVSSLAIKDENSQGEGIVFHDNKKAQLSMHEILAGGDSPLYPEINYIIERKGIDFKSLPKNEMMIHMKNIPKWNTSKHYWEQETDTLQFYVDEFKKITNGIIVDGVHIEPWFYYHINIFVTSFPDERINPLTKELELYNKIGQPHARDNEWWVIQDNYAEARKQGLMLFLAASRRVAKTTLLASHLDWCTTIGKLNILCAGGATKDLDQIEANFKITTLKKNPAFKVYNINDDWTKKIELGLKKKDGKNLILSTLHIINLNKGGGLNSEILAGYTPDAVVIDEIMKVPFIDQLAALKPALGATTAKRCVVILSGCVCAGTKVYTNAGRVVNIEELQQEDGILGYDGIGVSEEPITWMKPVAIKPCYRIITTGNNMIECSNDHPFLTSSKSNKEKATFDKAENLKVGDYLHITYDAPKFGDEYNKDARLLGLLIGDGYNPPNGSEIAVEGEDIYNFLKDNYSATTMKTFKTKLDTNYRRVYIRKSGEITKKAEIAGLVSINKKFPKNIHTYNKESLCEFIGGYFDADGSVSISIKKSSMRIRLTSISKNLIDELKFNLLKLGIDCTVSESNRTEICFKKYKHLKNWELSISKYEDIIRFRENIKFLSQDKQDKLNQVLNFKDIINTNKNGIIKRFEKTNSDKGDYFVDKANMTNFRRVSIKSIEYIGEKEVYNLTAGRTNTYLANGFITHNTAGNEELAKDAFKVLGSPDTNDVLGMRWDVFNSRVDKEDRTWKDRKFGTFIPGQMAQKEGLIKIDSNVADFLKKEDAEGLRKIKIKVTDWKLAKTVLLAARKHVQGDPKAVTKEKLYHPLDPEEMLLSSKTNPFPHEEAKRHLNRIREEGLIGRKVDIVREYGKIDIQHSDKEIPVFPFQGGYHDSPVLIFGEFPTEKPPRGLFVASLDDYKQEQADSDSLGCFIIYKRQSGNDEWGDRIAAIYTSRPNPHSKFHRWGHLLLEAYNAECLMENEDMEFKVFLDGIRETEKYLVPSFNMAGDLTLKSNNRRTYGISPNGNKSTIINKVVNYCKHQHTLINESGEPYTILGVELINDEMLLEEIINYREGENHDRITTYGISLIQAHYLDSNYVEARLKEVKRTERNTTPNNNKLFTHTRRKLF